jgi:hypothetical protein
VSLAKSVGFWVNISSTLSLRRIPQLESTLVGGVDLLTVSVSGIDQATYQINHVGGNIEYVFGNLALIRDIIQQHSLRTCVDIRLLRFDYNAHQEQALRDYAASMGFHFELTVGVGDPRTSNLKQEYPPIYFDQEMAVALDKPSPEEQGQSCELMFRQMAIDCNGDVYICCAMPLYPSLRIGRFLDMTCDEILAAKFSHPFCRACTMPRRERSPAEAEWLARIGLTSRDRADSFSAT